MKPLLTLVTALLLTLGCATLGNGRVDLPPGLSDPALWRSLGQSIGVAALCPEEHLALPIELDGQLEPRLVCTAPGLATTLCEDPAQQPVGALLRADGELEVLCE